MTLALSELLEDERYEGRHGAWNAVAFSRYQAAPQYSDALVRRRMAVLTEDYSIRRR
jgi:hypothetical protein